MEGVLGVQFMVVGKVDAEELVQDSEYFHEVGAAGVLLARSAKEYEELVVGVANQLRFGSWLLLLLLAV